MDDGEPVVLQAIVEVVAEAGRSDRLRAAMVRENGGRVVQALLKDASRRRGVLLRLRVADIVIPGGDLDGVRLEEAVLSRAEFKRVDLRRTLIERSIGSEVLFLEPYVDPSFTRLEIEGIDPWAAVVGVRHLVDEEADPEYDPMIVAQVMNGCGLGTPKSAPVVAEDRWAVSKAVKTVVSKMAHAFMRTNVICEADDTLRSLVNAEEWPTVLSVAIEHGVVSEESRATRGAKKAFFRREVLPEQLLAGESKAATVPGKITAVWAALERKSAPKD